MTQTFHFISGLPRSGSTLLAAILRQNPRFHAAMTSPVGSLFASMFDAMNSRNETALFISQQQRKDVLHGVMRNYYQSLEDKPVIFDTNRLWCSKLPALTQLYPEAKVICCVRDVGWIMNSFEKAFRSNPLQGNKVFNNDSESNTVYSRIDTLGQRDRTVGFAWCALKEAFYSEFSSSLLLVDYDLLVTEPQKTLALIYQFIDEPAFSHDFENLHYSEPQFDENLGVAGLHDIRGPVKRHASRCILPPDLFAKYSEMAFWNDSTGSEAHIIRAKA